MIPFIISLDKLIMSSEKKKRSYILPIPDLNSEKYSSYSEDSSNDRECCVYRCDYESKLCQLSGCLISFILIGAVLIIPFTFLMIYTVNYPLHTPYGDFRDCICDLKNYEQPFDISRLYTKAYCQNDTVDIAFKVVPPCPAYDCNNEFTSNEVTDYLNYLKAIGKNTTCKVDYESNIVDHNKKMYFKFATIRESDTLERNPSLSSRMDKPEWTIAVLTLTGMAIVVYLALYGFWLFGGICEC